MQYYLLRGLTQQRPPSSRSQCVQDLTKHTARVFTTQPWHTLAQQSSTTLHTVTCIIALRLNLTQQACNACSSAVSSGSAPWSQQLYVARCWVCMRQCITLHEALHTRLRCKTTAFPAKQTLLLQSTGSSTARQQRHLGMHNCH